MYMGFFFFFALTEKEICVGGYKAHYSSHSFSRTVPPLHQKVERKTTDRDCPTKSPPSISLMPIFRSSTR